MREKLFVSQMKMGDVIAANPNLILVLPRLGIPMGFGDKTVAAVCARYGVDVEFFLLICNVYSHDLYLPQAEVLSQTDLSLLVPYLVKSHVWYIEKRIPHIEHHLQRISESLPAKIGGALISFFSDYKNEVVSHFSYEEEHVFPYIEDLLSGGVKKKKLPASDFLSVHDNIEDKLDDLKQIIFKYLPEDVSAQDDMTSVVFDIFQLSNDLRKHALIEEKILMPYLESLKAKK